MTLRSLLRIKPLANARRRPASFIDSNRDQTRIRATGDPRLDLALSIERAAFR